jgi:hypothetical protein
MLRDFGIFPLSGALIPGLRAEDLILRSVMKHGTPCGVSQPPSPLVDLLPLKTEGQRLCIPKSDCYSTRLSYFFPRVTVECELHKQELSELERNFKSFIQSHLDEEDTEDYDLVWQWEKFLFDKAQRAQT